MDSVNVPILPELTARQRDCLMRVKQGMSAKEIGRELQISHRTVEIHVAAAIKKLGVSNRYAAIAVLHGETGREHEPLSSLLETAPAPDRAREAPLGRSIMPPLGGIANAAGTRQRAKWILCIALGSVMITCFIIISVLGAVGFVNSSVGGS